MRRDVSWLTASPESSVNFTPLHELDGIITPNGLCFERHHSGIAELDPNDYRLMIHGLVDKPLMFTLQDLERFPRTNRIYFAECAANSGMEFFINFKSCCRTRFSARICVNCSSTRPNCTPEPPPRATVFENALIMRSASEPWIDTARSFK